VHGTTGVLAWDFHRMGELDVGRGGSPRDQTVSTVFVGPRAGEYAAFQPGAGIAMSYDDLKVIESAMCLRSSGERRPYRARPEDAVRCAELLDAMAGSAASGSWVHVDAG
jgi:predicted dehydrogenase